MSGQTVFVVVTAALAPKAHSHPFLSGEQVDMLNIVKVAGFVGSKSEFSECVGLKVRRMLVLTQENRLCWPDKNLPDHSEVVGFGASVLAFVGVTATVSLVGH